LKVMVTSMRAYEIVDSTKVRTSLMRSTRVFFQARYPANERIRRWDQIGRSNAKAILPSLPKTLNLLSVFPALSSQYASQLLRVTLKPW
jgi:hypothetical protein